MLTRAHRLVNPLDFRRVVRRGGRFSGTFLICYVASASRDAPRAGFIVAKNVGGAVTRNLVKRRLRAATAELWVDLHGDLVVRALPAAAAATYVEMRGELTRAFRESRARLSLPSANGQQR